VCALCSRHVHEVNGHAVAWSADGGGEMVLAGAEALRGGFMPAVHGLTFSTGEATGR
jgi:hypothetical protein